MTDIVERLQSADRNSVQAAIGSRIFGEAADEINRLRAALEYIGAECEWHRWAAYARKTLAHQVGDK